MGVEAPFTEHVSTSSCPSNTDLEAGGSVYLNIGNETSKIGNDL